MFLAKTSSGGTLDTSLHPNRKLQRVMATMMPTVGGLNRALIHDTSMRRLELPVIPF